MKTLLWILILGACYSCFGATSEPGLLFYLSGDHEFNADYAEGNPQPNFLRDVKIIQDGAKGRGFECAGTQLMSYWAPGNIYAERGTLAFDWRSRGPVGPTPFPIFRVAYADHSSWDMVWLRIDYNGRGGFDAFVTDINLARIRVSYVMPAFPKPSEWVHLALAWDETRGIRFYVNGALAAQQNTQAVLYAGLDQFGPHSRTISPLQVQSAYNFIRGGDIDEIRIYDRMLTDEHIASLARGATPPKIPELVRNVDQKQWRDEWWLRYGWNRKGDPPPYLDAQQTSVRKVEIHDVYDLKRWWWKGTDGIRETTWPGVFNRSRLPGRNDYFQLPDWDCYSLSGKSVTFNMPDEPWNHLEISGAAWGKMYLEAERPKLLFQRPRGSDKTFHRLSRTLRGQKIRFENVEQEEPIGELSAYNVGAGTEPQGSARLSYTLHSSERGNLPSNQSSALIAKFITGRYTSDERATMIAVADGKAAVESNSEIQNRDAAQPLPLVHIVIPADGWQNISDGLDGIAIDLPALKFKAASQELLPLNIQVKDPLWVERNLLDFSFSVKPDEARTLWLDTRDRILPSGKALYLTIAAAGANFGAASLEGVRVRMIFKPRPAALKEHELDRFTQARDNYAMMVEERPNDPRLNLYNRFAADITDLLRVNPNHWLAQAYWYDIDRRHPKPTFTQPAPPPGAPLWAFRQVEQLRNLKRFVLWYIDHRQIENGEFGGGLSDDGDLTNFWPGTALMGCEPEKIKESLLRELDAFYEQGMFTNGLSTIQADDLHSYEEGISTIGQALLLDHGNPKQLERAMETARALNRITGINSAGHRHIRSSYFSGSKIAEEEPWGWTRSNSYLLTQPALMLVDYNGIPATQKLILELADGLLAHRKRDETGRYRLRFTVKFQTDEDQVSATDRVWPIFWAAWRWTSDGKYLQPLQDEGLRSLDMITSNALDQLSLRQTWGSTVAASAKPGMGTDASQHLAWQITGDKRFLETLYAGQIENSALREYINTEGSLWIDRVSVAYSELQRARLGGVALVRNAYFPGHAVSWTFQAPANEESVAILIPNATSESLKIIAYNLKETPVKATMTAWDLEPGRWEIVQGVDNNNDDVADGETLTSTVELERSGKIDFILTGRTANVLSLKLVAKALPYWARPDLGIGADDVKVRAKTVSVTVHSLGAVDTPPTTLVLLDSGGKVLSSVQFPRLKAPVDLLPKTITINLPVTTRSRIVAGSVVVDPEGVIKEITRVNNRVRLK
jgi:concanavalin A-like lectin/glucanase superfamily protein